jgi:hypothetical protein
MNGASRFGRCLVAWGLWMLLLSLGAYVDEAYGLGCEGCNIGNPVCSGQPPQVCMQGVCSQAWPSGTCAGSCDCKQTFDGQRCKCQ